MTELRELGRSGRLGPPAIEESVIAGTEPVIVEVASEGAAEVATSSCQWKCTVPRQR